MWQLSYHMMAHTQTDIVYEITHRLLKRGLGHFNCEVDQNYITLTIVEAEYLLQ